VVKTVKTKKITQKQTKQAQSQDVAAANIPLVDARPSDQPVNIVAKTGKTPTAPAQEEANNSVVAAPSAPASGGSYVIQIASAPSPDQAEATYASLNRKFGRIIGGRGMNIQKADIPGKGTFYRVRISAGSKQEAAALCAKYKSAGGQCLVAR
jgi:cell division septation protein DedD